MKNYFIHKYIDRDHRIERLSSGKSILLPKVITSEDSLREILNKLPDFNEIYYKAGFNVGDFVKLCTNPDYFTYGYNSVGMVKAIGSIQVITKIDMDGRVYFNNPTNCKSLSFSYSVDDIIEIIKEPLEKYKFDNTKEQWVLSYCGQV